MRIVLFPILSIALLGACTTAKEINGPSGSKGYYVSCNGAIQSVRSCYMRAAEVCPNGYEIIDQGNSKNIFGGNAIKKGIFIECKK